MTATHAPGGAARPGPRVLGRRVARRARQWGLLACLTLASILVPASARAQSGPNNVQQLLPQVMPGAQRFSAKEGTPPVFRGYRVDPATGKETLVGYAFLTADLPPEETGYTGPIRMLVGLDVQGHLTGTAILDYVESHRGTRGDFLRARGFQEQFAGKSISDPFRVRRDVDGISGATISASAVARGIRSSARRIATAYLTGLRGAVAVPLRPGTVTAAELEPLSWPDIVDSGLVQQLTILDEGRAAIDLSLVFLRDPSLGTTLMGARPFEEALAKAGEAAAERHVMLLGVDGPVAALFRPQVLFLVQGEDTLRFTPRDVVQLGAPTAGKVDGQFRSVGLVFVDRAIDAKRPFTIGLDLRPGMGFDTAEFPGLTVGATVDAVAAAPPPEAAPAEAEPMPAADALLAADAAGRALAAPPPLVGAEAALDQGEAAVLDFDFDLDEVEEETVLARTLANTSWARVGGLLVVLALATAAFFAKRRGLRWAALTATIAFLGFFDGGFLSISHLTSGIKVGPSVYLSDISLLLLVGFVVVTTLLWGRVFCGFLCPFGALQDFMERVVPKRLRRELPRRVHERAWLVKYGVLALVLTPAVLGSDATIYQYFEPFGTVFFLSSSLLLWSIAGAILVGVAIVPRFYCRYLCPLGAALGLASSLSPLRIRRVEQCSHCKVCEQRCPTGAIQKETVNFRECVRCNVCEIQLNERAGVCKHDMETLRPRLVKLEPARPAGAAHGR